MTDQKQLNPVPFHGDTIYAVEHDGEPYAPVRPIIENMGLDWKNQYRKLLAKRERFCVVILTTQLPGDNQGREVVCIPVRKLAGFLATINHNKVRNELRAKVLAYQRECDDALWEYWTGAARQDRTGRREFDGLDGIHDEHVSPNQRIRLLSLAIRAASMSREERDLAFSYYNDFCARTAAGNGDGNGNGKKHYPRVPEHVELFLSGYCIEQPGMQETKDALYGAYCSFCHKNNVDPLPPALFFKHLYSTTCAQSIKTRDKKRNRRVQAVAGIGLL